MIKSEDIKTANDLIENAKVDIKGKKYALVNDRIRAFRSICPNYGINTDIVSLVDGVVTMKTVITDENGMVVASGMSQEKEQGSFINKTSFIENAETSAVGRALGFLGIGVDGSIASADEVANAILNQGQPKKEDGVREAELKAKVMAYFNRHDFDKEKLDNVAKHYKVKSVKDLTGAHCADYIESLKKKGVNVDE